MPRRLSFEEALAASDDLRLLHMQRLLLRDVIKAGANPEDAQNVFVRQGSLLDVVLLTFMLVGYSSICR